MVNVCWVCSRAHAGYSELNNWIRKIAIYQRSLLGLIDSRLLSTIQLNGLRLRLSYDAVHLDPHRLLKCCPAYLMLTCRKSGEISHHSRFENLSRQGIYSAYVLIPSVRKVALFPYKDKVYLTSVMTYVIFACTSDNAMLIQVLKFCLICLSQWLVRLPRMIIPDQPRMPSFVVIIVPKYFAMMRIVVFIWKSFRQLVQNMAVRYMLMC